MLILDVRPAMPPFLGPSAGATTSTRRRPRWPATIRASACAESELVRAQGAAQRVVGTRVVVQERRLPPAHGDLRVALGAILIGGRRPQARLACRLGTCVQGGGSRLGLRLTVPTPSPPSRGAPCLRVGGERRRERRRRIKRRVQCELARALQAAASPSESALDSHSVRLCHERTVPNHAGK